MIAFLEGRVADTLGGHVVLDVHGVGYELLVPTSTLTKLPAIGKVARVHTRMVVRDDAMTLYGFATMDERELFDLLVTVTGVGPKVALSFLSVLSSEALRRAIASGDLAALTAIPGVGKKVAQRVALDLKDKLGGDVVIVDGPLAEVREALLALGLTPQEASEAMVALPADEETSTEDLLRTALQQIGRG